MNRKQVRSQIQQIGIIPSVRFPSYEDARFAAENVSQGGLHIAEISSCVPRSVHLISELVRNSPNMIVGAGSILDVETARRCLDAGAQFLTTDGLIPEVVEFAKAEDVVVFPGALTPTEVIAAWRAGSDFVKVVPCAAMGGESYIRFLKTPLAQVPLIAAGGVNQQTAPGYLSAGADALGIGEALMPWDAVALRQANRIRELARRFRNFVETANRGKETKHEEAEENRAVVLALNEG